MTPYLTVEQVRDAANAWLEAQRLPPSARMAHYRQTADRIAYYQRRNQQARRAHHKKTLHELHLRDVKISHLKSCVPHNLYDYMAL